MLPPIPQAYKMTFLKKLHISKSSYCFPISLNYSSLWTSKLFLSLKSSILFKHCLKVPISLSKSFENITWTSLLSQDDRNGVRRGLAKEPSLIWKKLWSKIIFKCDFEDFETVPMKSVLNKIVSLAAKIMGLKVNNIDFIELVEEHS